MAITFNHNDKLYVSGSNVGIGTDSPQKELHIKGNNGWGEVRVEGQTFASGHGASLEFYSEGTALADIYASTDKHLYFRTNGTTERMRITSGGNVGIGTTSPASPLHVVGSRIRLDVDTGGFYKYNADGSTFRAAFYDDGSVTSIYADGDGSTPYMTFSDSNVGIGTTSPSEKLEVTGNVKVNGQIKVPLASGNGIYLDGFSAATEPTISNGAGNVIVYRTSGGNTGTGAAHIFNNHSGTTYLGIYNNGNVGIGTTSPAYKLDVTGEGRFTGTLYSNNILRGSSLKTGTISSAQPRLDSFYMQSGPETGQAIAHPYLMSDLAAFELRGGTVTVTGLTTPPTYHNNLFRPNAEIWQTAASNYTGSTFVIELSDVDHVEALRYGTYCGIQFGNSTWAPASLKIEWSTDDGSNYTTALNSSAKSDFYYTKLNNGAAAITNIKFTIGQPTSALRILNIFATDYAGRGSSAYHLSAEGGTLYGKLYLSDVDSNTSSTTALVLNGTEVEKRTLGSAAFSAATDFVAVSGDTMTDQLVIQKTGDFTAAKFKGTGANGYGSISIENDLGTALVLGSTGSTKTGTFFDNARYIGATSGELVLKTYSSTDGHMKFLTGGQNERMRITADGNVGIGNSSPNNKLDVSGNVNASEYRIGNGVKLEASSSYTMLRDPNGVRKIYIGGANDEATYIDGNTIYFRTKGGGSTRMVINSSGNVGIGTTSISAKLVVKGADSAADFADYGIAAFENQQNEGLSIGYDTGDNYSYLYSREVGVSSRGLRLNGSIYVAGINGNVGIGTTSPGAKLDITTDNTSQIPIRVTHNNYNDWLIQKRRSDDTQKLGIKEISSNGGMALVTADSERMHITSSGYTQIKAVSGDSRLYLEGTTGTHFLTGTSGGAFGIYSGTANSYRMFIKSDGNVGIGTTSPVQKLDVSGAIKASSYVYTNELRANADSGSRIVIHDGGGNIEFRTQSGTERMTIAYGGNVGIGTSSPSEKMHVAGNVRATGWIGRDSDNYITFDETNNHIDFYAGGNWVARMESDGDLHVKGDVIAFSDIFNP